MAQTNHQRHQVCSAQYFNSSVPKYTPWRAPHSLLLILVHRDENMLHTAAVSSIVTVSRLTRLRMVTKDVGRVSSLETPFYRWPCPRLARLLAIRSTVTESGSQERNESEQETGKRIKDPSPRLHSFKLLCIQRHQ